MSAEALRDPTHTPCPQKHRSVAGNTVLPHARSPIAQGATGVAGGHTTTAGAQGILCAASISHLSFYRLVGGGQTNFGGTHVTDGHRSGDRRVKTNVWHPCAAGC